VYYSAASDLAKQLNELYELGKKEGGDSGGLSRVIAEEQTNSLIVVGTEESYMRLLELLRRVDTAPAAEGRIHVLPLQHADAEELSKTLTRMLGGSGGGAAPAAGAKKAGAAGTGVAEMFEGDVRLTEDKATNSLVVSSSARDFAQLRLVVERLDQKRRQVFLEAVIMDVSVDRTSKLGLSYHGGATTNLVGGEDSVIVGGFNPITSISPGADQLQALALGVRGPELDGTQNLPGLPPGVSIPAFGVFLNALATSGDSNVLSTPHIIATDNIEAEINIGENVPLQTNFAGGSVGNLASLAQSAAGAAGTGAAAGLGGALGALGGGFGFNAQRTDVGTKIKITPHINDEHQVRLEIEEEISETGASSGSLGAVSITQRRASTTVVVDDQQTVVIGGLMRDTKSMEKQKVPVLGDLPVLGFLFRNSTERMRKTNLLLILTPHVIRDQQDLRKVFQRKMQERQQFLDRYFLFTSEWEPPRDFTRTNGLVEDIRQAYFEMDERQRLEEESRPREQFVHEASAPLELSGDVRAGQTQSAGAAAPAAPAGAKPTPAKPARTPRNRRGGSGEPEGNAAPIRINPVARNVDDLGHSESAVGSENDADFEVIRVE
jgi:general secretion pathway protein D